jgi:hypothetical protein
MKSIVRIIGLAVGLQTAAAYGEIVSTVFLDPAAEVAEAAARPALAPEPEREGVRVAKTARQPPAVPLDVRDWKLDELAAVFKESQQEVNRPCEPAKGCVPCRVLDPLGADPLWSGRTEGLLLWRSNPQSVPLFQPIDGLAGLGGLNAADFTSGMAAGPRFTLFRHTPDLGAIELNFLRVQSFTSTASLPQTQGGYLETPHGIFCCPSEIPVDSVEGQFSSALQSFELNRRFPTEGRWQWLTGFRWVQWNEEIGLASGYARNQFTDTYGSQTFNDLYGWQVGADSILWGLGGPLRIEGLGKAGLYYNQSAQRSTTTVGATLPPSSLSVATDVARAAFVGELGVTGVYDITRWLSLRAGYTIFWLGGLATAANQLDAQVLCPGQPILGATDTGGSVFVQGLTLGLEGRW